MNISAKGKSFAALNEEIRTLSKQQDRIEVTEVEGHRYIGAGLPEGKKLLLYGTPGNDMCAYMDGAEVEVFGNGQDAAGNTMNSGRIVIHGSAGDALGYAMRGGEIFVQGNVGYRCGIHMKEFGSAKPIIVIGGSAGSFLGEYMAGGMIILLGRSVPADQSPAASFCATGMHGGVMYLRRGVPEAYLSKEVVAGACSAEDEAVIRRYAEAYAACFGENPSEIHAANFIKVRPASSRPYGNLYVKN